MSEISDYKRIVSGPQIASLEATIKALRAEIEGLRAAPHPSAPPLGSVDSLKLIEIIIYENASISHFGTESEVDNAAYLAREILAILSLPAEGGAREAAIEECAKHLEHEADVATNSLHCGDNSQTIAATHRVSRAYHEAASSIRALAIPRPTSGGGA